MNPQKDSWQGRLEFASLSDVGLRRANNQDSMTVMVAPSLAAWHQRGDLFIVADGMGAHAAGELASKLATDTVPLVYHKLADRPPAQALAAAIEDANALIHSRGQANLDFKGMGTTCTALVLFPPGAMVAHVGDSRAYRLRANRLEQLTFDHSLVWEVRASGQVEGPVPDFIPKNVITRSLGPNPAVRVDVEGPLRVLPDDVYLLCSDGLSGPVKDEEIGMILACLKPADAVRALVDLANLRGGPDNITIVVVRAVGNVWRAGAAGAPELPMPTRPVHPSVWGVAGAMAAVGVSLMILGGGLLLPGVLALLLAVLVGGGGIVYRSSAAPLAPLGGRSFGRGPYTATPCAADAEFTDRLSVILRDLREAATQESWNVDWDRFHALADPAAAAVESGDFPQAVRCYFQAIGFMLVQLKQHGKAHPDPPK